MTDETIAGRYRLLEPLGHGAMSSVWRAHDEELDRDVAIKQLAPTADRTRFEREARAVAALAHPNICNLYDYGESDGKPYMVLEYLPGGTLEDRLKTGKLTDADTERYANEIAAGLAHAHGHGVVHRDLKPANVLFDSEDRAKIADFGIARMGDAGTLTEAGTVLGTAAYISPEQAAGLPATAASDVYSFGVLLFRMLTGRLPFVADNAMELVRMNRDDPPPAVADVRADAPTTLAATADAALRKDPAARPADGAALLAALQDTTGSAATMVLPAAATAAAPARRSRSLLPALIVLVAVLLLGGAALALALATGSDNGSSGGGPPPTINVPTVPTVKTHATTTQPTTTAPATTAPTTTAPTTTEQTTTQHTTTAHTTTHSAPPPPPPPQQTTTAPPPPTFTATTTYDTTTYDTTTVDTTTVDTTGTTTTGP